MSLHVEVRILYVDGNLNIYSQMFKKKGKSTLKYIQRKVAALQAAALFYTRPNDVTVNIFHELMTKKPPAEPMTTLIGAWTNCLNVSAIYLMLNQHKFTL